MTEKFGHSEAGVAQAEIAGAAARKAWQVPTLDVVPARDAEANNAGFTDEGVSS